MRWLEQHWYRNSLLHVALWPVSLVFAALAALRRVLFRHGVLAATRLPVPVIVVGNISVGGTGKTPLVIWLARQLRACGLSPAIVCSGYGGRARTPQAAAVDSDPQLVGDEAVLLARHSGCPVWIGARRAMASQQLLAAHPDCNIIVSDDGLQHYALARDAEIAVIDGERGFGNGMLLPAGPLREPLRRLAKVDAIVVNGTARFSRNKLPAGVPSFGMTLGGSTFYSLPEPARQAGPEHFAGRPLHAVAAIGNPARFFSHLRELGMSFIAHPFPDHHPLSAADFEFAANDAVIMTEKDAVKCERFCNTGFWALPVEAATDPALCKLILEKIRK